MSIAMVIVIFAAYCVIAAVIRLLERMAEGTILRRRQDMLMDAAYSKLARLAAKAVADWRQMQAGGEYRDKV